jgi:hypothetical protein
MSKDSEIETSVYPQLEQSSFIAFLKKIGVGLIFSYLPALAYVSVSEDDLSRIWGITLMVTAGVYLLIGGCSDLSQNSARKSHKRYMERIDRTGEREMKFKYELGFFQYGKNLENLGAAICLLSISILL